MRHIKTASLREQIAMVPQETILFSGTIADNIADRAARSGYV